MSGEQWRGWLARSRRVIADAPFGAVTEPIRQATPKDVGYMPTEVPISAG
jgi:hypothetical protein